MLAIFEKFRYKCDEIYELDPVRFVSAPGLAWHARLRNTKAKLESITNYDMLMMVENGIRGGICQATHRYAKSNNRYMRNYKNIESIISSLFRCRKIVWMGNVSKITSKWF